MDRCASAFSARPTLPCTTFGRLGVPHLARRQGPGRGVGRPGLYRGRPRANAPQRADCESGDRDSAARCAGGDAWFRDCFLCRCRVVYGPIRFPWAGCRAAHGVVVPLPSGAAGTKRYNTAFTLDGGSGERAGQRRARRSCPAPGPSVTWAGRQWVEPQHPDRLRNSPAAPAAARGGRLGAVEYGPGQLQLDREVRLVDAHSYYLNCMATQLQGHPRLGFHGDPPQPRTRKP